MTRADLIAFEEEVAEAFAAGKIRGPVHLVGGNEDQLIELFARIDRRDWVFSTYRSHLHALLHGLPRDFVMGEIMAGRSMNINSAQHRFMTSAIVAGCLPIATGVAAAIKRSGSPRRVWCFVGDMAARTGAFSEATRYASGHALPITFIVEDNGYSTNTPTREVWGAQAQPCVETYTYKRSRPHVGIGRFVQF